MWSRWSRNRKRSWDGKVFRLYQFSLFRGQLSSCSEENRAIPDESMIDPTHPSEEWEKELEEAPILRDLKRETVFQPPEGYFDKLSEELNLAMEDQEVLEQAPTLSAIQKQTIFQVPSDYFAQFPKRIMGLIEAVPLRSQSQGKVRSIRWMRPRYALAVAAAVSLLVLAGIWLRPSNTPLQLDDVPVDELMAYIEQENISTETIIEVLGEEDFLAEEMEDASEFPEEDFSDLLEEMEEGELEDLLIEI